MTLPVYENAFDQLGFSKELYLQMTPEEQEYVLTILAELDQEGESETYKDLVSVDYKFEPPSWRQFVEDEYYAGKMGKTLYPMIVDEFEEIFLKDVSEVILSGSIGWGKSYGASFGLAYDLVWLLCLADPQTYCGIAAGTDITLLNLSVTGRQAQGGIYSYVSEFIKDMPFIKENFGHKYDFEKHGPQFFEEHVKFICGGSSEFGAIGSNMIGGAMDEANRS